MKAGIITLLTVAFVTLFSQVARAEKPDAKVQAAIDAKVKAVQAWASDPAIIAAVKEQNATLPADYAAMTQDKWKGLTVMDPFVRSFTKNAAGTFLKGKKDDFIAEAFLSAADGKKVAFLAKTSNWSHQGKPKHDDPMKGKIWQGEIEVDESSGVQCVQVSVPVLDGDKAIGVLTVGFNVSKMKE